MAPERPQPNAVADLLEREHDRIIQRWKDRVIAMEAQAQAVSPPALVDSMPDFLRQVIAALRHQRPLTLGDQPSWIVESAREHGRQRYRIGFDLRVVVLEYNLLREALFDVVEASDLPLHDSDHRVVFTAFANGIAEAVDQYSRDREDDLRANAAERERASEFERQLIAIVSHDLRSPLAAILMSAEVATRLGSDDERLALLLTRIRMGAQRATRLIADLLDFTQERKLGRIPVKPRPVSLRHLVREAITEAESMFPGRTIAYQEDDPLDGEWDPDRIAQVLSNLLTNAFKYGAPGTAVTVRTSATADAVVCEIHNWGPPIPASRMPTLFEAFQSADPVSRTQPSLGLGLYISRQIVGAHGGSIDVRSTDEAGTTFVVRLPRRPPAARA